jgi:hypothetical protein
MSDETVWGIHSDNPRVDFIGSEEVSIGWQELGDPRNIGNDREALKALLAQTYPEAKPGAIPGWAGMLARFVYEMQIGDLVVYSGKADESFNIGKITGEYEYRDSGDGNPNVRAIEWLKIGEPRAAFSGAARAPMRSSLSLFKLPATADEFRLFLETGAHPEPGKVMEPGVLDVDSEGAEAAIAALITGEHRDDILEVLATSIRYVHDVAPNGWCLTLKDNGETVRLNLRNAQALALRSGGVINLEVIDEAIPAELFTELEADDLLVKWSKNLFEDTSSVTIDPDRCGRYWAGLEDAHLQYLDALAPKNPTGKSAFWQSHRPDLVNALSNLTGEQLPQPAYVNQQGSFVTDAVARAGSAPAPKPALDAIVSLIQAGGLRLSEQTIRRYHLSIETRGFVILAGLSGSGKTQLARQYSAAVGAKMLLVPVAPNWTANEDLLGYSNPLNGEYVDTEFSRFLAEASAEFGSASAEDREPLEYHLILDEMNLARVEYYFAKFLSAMELTNGPELPTIELGGEQVQLTPNLKFIGTVNVDETTHGFADKVYDRAQLIEIPVDRDQIAAHLDGRPYRELLLSLYDALFDVAPFAYRVLDSVGNYVSAATEAGVSWQDATDEQILQKVLPKVKGTDPRIGVALLAVIELTNEGFPLSNAKARQMSDAFRNHGFVSFF